MHLTEAQRHRESELRVSPSVSPEFTNGHLRWPFAGVWHEVPNVRVKRRKDVSPGKLDPVFCCSPTREINTDFSFQLTELANIGFDDE